ncbi:MAG: VOC family protein [Pseudomonadota bacterium]
MPTGLNHITIAVRDIEKSLEFYAGTLGFVPVAKWDKGAYLEMGDLWLALIKDDERSLTSSQDYSHFALSCSEAEFESSVERLNQYGCTEWSENKSEGASFYFLDPDGHKLELHVGDLQTRLKAMRENHRGNVQFFR